MVWNFSLFFFSLQNTGGSGVSVPSPRGYKKLRDDLNKAVDEGKYLLGELIAPKEIKKIVIGQDGEMSTQTCIVEGRRIPLRSIRKIIFSEHTNIE